jgi:hypothetical protein
MFKSLFVILLALGLSSCSFIQSQHGETVVSEDYQDYLNKKQDLLVFEKARTAQELKNWK